MRIGFQSPVAGFKWFLQLAGSLFQLSKAGAAYTYLNQMIRKTTRLPSTLLRPSSTLLPPRITHTFDSCTSPDLIFWKGGKCGKLVAGFTVKVSAQHFGLLPRISGFWEKGRQEGPKWL